MNFDQGAAGFEGDRCSLLRQPGHNATSVEFSDLPTHIAQQERWRVRMAQVLAGREGLKTRDPVDEPFLLKKVQRPIDSRRLGFLIALEPIKEIVGFHRPFRLKQIGKELSAKGSHVSTSLRANLLCFR